MLGVLALIALAASRPAAAADEIHWTIMGPTAVSFDWRGVEDTLRYGLTAAHDQAVAAQQPSPIPVSSSGPFREARLTGLIPDTLYHYAIGGGDDHVFRTPRKPGASDFTVYAEADIGSTLNYWRVGPVQDLIAAGHPDFTLLVGDLSYGNDKGDASVDQFFNDIMKWSQDAGAMPAWGNHEWEPGDSTDDLRNYKGRFDLPNSRASVGSPAISCCGKDWYWFDYGNVRFIAYPEPWSGAWAEWYPQARALMDSAQADPDINFIVTFGHRPAYSSGHHPGSAQLRAYLDSLGATHEKYKLNINGHSHDYERSFPQNGVVHITTGGGGSKLEDDPAGDCLWLGGCPPPPWSAFRALHHETIRLSFAATTIHVDAICGPPGDASDPQDLDCVEGSVLDSVTLSVQPPDGIIAAPLGDTLTIVQGQAVDWTGQAVEHDGDQDALLFHWTFGGGAAEQTVESPGPVVFGTPGVYRVTFTVTDLEGFRDPTPDTRVVLVRPSAPNQLPEAALALAPATGNAPLATIADARGSWDPDGRIVSYRFDFGDGSGVGPGAAGTAAHQYGAGRWTAAVTVTDDRGGARTATWPVIVAAVDPGANLVANPSAEASLAGWSAAGGAHLATAPGGFDGDYAFQAVGSDTLAPFGINDSPNWVGTVEGAQMPYRFTAWVRSPAGHGLARLQVREYDAGAKVGPTTYSAFDTLSSTWQPLEVERISERAGSTLDFQVLDYPAAAGETLQVDNIAIRVPSATTGAPAGVGDRLEAWAVPNPVPLRGAFEFSLPGPSSVRLEVLDLSGRRVRLLLDAPSLDPGPHRAAFDGRASNGSPLPAGVYFYRLQTNTGTITRRFAFLR